MKKILSAILAGVMVLGLVGCGSKGGDSSSAKDVPTADLVNTVMESEEIQMRMVGPVEGELAETTFHLNLDDVEEYTIQKGMMNTGLETVAVVKAKDGKVDAVIITGGIAYSNKITSMIKKKVEFIAPVEIYAGENELESLALGTLRVLKGEEEARIYHENELAKA